jgi:hypothetical protein
LAAEAVGLIDAWRGRSNARAARRSANARWPAAAVPSGAGSKHAQASREHAFWIGLGVQELTGGAETSSSREPHGVQFPAPGCTSLTLDRREGNTIAEPCLGEALPMREARARSLDRASLP